MIIIGNAEQSVIHNADITDRTIKEWNLLEAFFAFRQSYPYECLRAVPQKVANVIYDRLHL